MRYTERSKRYEVEKVDEFTYLGVVIEEYGHEKQEIKARIAKGNQKYGSLRTLMKSKYLSRKTKLRIYRTVIRPTTTYACETWVLNKTEEEQLERWERKILRKILGGINTEEGWRRRTHQEMYEQYKKPKITIFVREQRIRWLGQIERMASERMPKLVLRESPLEEDKKEDRGRDG